MANLPCLGAGLGYRPAFSTDLLRHIHDLDFVEIVGDAFLRDPSAAFSLGSLRPVIPHFLDLSVGSLVDESYLSKVSEFVRALKPPWFSDHLAFTHTEDLAVGHLAPVPLHHESLERVISNVRKVTRQLNVPFALENITVPFYWPDDTMTEPEFLSRVVRETGCFLLLDLENVRVNTKNHGRAARDMIDKLPLERVIQVHIAGGWEDQTFAHDSHSAPVSEATWELLTYLCEVHKPAAVMIERDQGFPSFGELLAEVRRARSILMGGSAA